MPLYKTVPIKHRVLIKDRQIMGLTQLVIKVLIKELLILDNLITDFLLVTEYLVISGGLQELFGEG